MGDPVGAFVDIVGEPVGEAEGLAVGALHTPQALGQSSFHTAVLHSASFTVGLELPRNPQLGGSSSKWQRVGDAVGLAEGERDGSVVGVPDGARVGTALGIGVGCRLGDTEGRTLGDEEGDEVGEGDGERVGVEVRSCIQAPHMCGHNGATAATWQWSTLSPQKSRISPSSLAFSSSLHARKVGCKVGFEVGAGVVGEAVGGSLGWHIPHIAGQLSSTSDRPQSWPLQKM